MTESNIDTSKSNAVMDTLLEKLRAAGPSNDPKGARRRAAARKSLADHRRILSRSHEEVSIPSEPSEPKLEAQSSSPDSLTEVFTPVLEEKIEEDDDSKATNRRSSLVPPKSRRTSILRNPSITNVDDVGGRARQLLEELRKNGTPESPDSADNSSPRHSRSLSRSSSNKLAEMRARHENRRRSSQFYAENSLHLRSPSGNIMIEEPATDNNEEQLAEDRISIGNASEAIAENAEDELEITEVVEKQQNLDQ